MDGHPHRPQYGFWCSGRRATGRWPDFESPFCAGRMLVRPDDSGIDHDVLEIWIVRQRLEKTLPNAFARPSVEAHEHTVPSPKCRRQIAPRRAGAQDPKYRVDEQPVVLTGPPPVALLARDQIRNTHPLYICELAPNQDRLHQAAILNHNDGGEGIP